MMTRRPARLGSMSEATGEEVRVETRGRSCSILCITGRTWAFLRGGWEPWEILSRGEHGQLGSERTSGCVWKMDCQGQRAKGTTTDEVTAMVQAKDDDDWAQGVAGKVGRRP